MSLTEIWAWQNRLIHLMEKLILILKGKRLLPTNGNYDLQLAYAISVHKSRAEANNPVVIFPLLKQHFMMLQRNLVYTGLTREQKRKLSLVGDPAAYAMAIRNDKTLIRQTDLVRKPLFYFDK